MTEFCFALRRLQLRRQKVDNEDLWKRLGDIFVQLKEGHIDIRWIPSHVDFVRSETSLKECLAVWNDVVDRQAVQTNMRRGPDFEYTLWKRRMTALRTFYLEVAKSRQDEPEILDLTEDSDALVHQIS
eukprot:s1568_g3.t1